MYLLKFLNDKLKITKQKILLLILFFFIIWSFYLFFCIKDSKIVDPVVIIIQNKEKINFDEIEVYRVAPRKGNFKIDKIDENTYCSNKFYIKQLKISINKDTLNKIENVKIKIGKNVFNFSKDKLLLDWEIIEKTQEDKKYIDLYSPYYVKSKNSFIKLFNIIINWRGDFFVLFITFFYTLITIIIILFIILLYLLIDLNIEFVLKKYNMIFKKNKIKYISSLLFFILIWTIILILSGSFFSGYHILDDHEILRIENDLLLSNNNFLKTTFKWINNDIFHSNRFRPFYFIERIFRVYIFCDNFILISIYNYILAIFVSYILFYFTIKIGFTLFESIIFSCLTLIGSQSNIWWRLGPNETIAIFMFSISLIFLYMNIYFKKYNLIYEIIWILFIILMSLSKESFIIFLPSILLLKIWLYKYKNNIRWIDSIRHNIISSVLILSIFILEVLFIKLFMSLTWGHRQIGFYSFNLFKYIEVIIDFFLRGKIPLGVILIFLFFISGLLIYKIKGEKILFFYLKEISPAIILSFLIIMPQVVIYSKTYIHDRYMLPAIFGFTFFMILILRHLRKYKLYTLNIFLILLLLINITFNLKITFNEAEKFAEDGKNNKKVFNLIEKNTLSNDLILIVADPINIERIWSLKTYLNLKLKRSNLYFDAISIKSNNQFYYDDFMSLFYSYSEGKIFKNINDKDMISFILICQNLNNEFLKSSENWFNEKKYICENISDYYIYYKKL